ncbi:MAG: DUF3320 domain-containing protein [Methanoregulaceae archaeon]|nr:DUF3320 domain-containing protein [Methanoregulaceae archaeon]
MHSSNEEYVRIQIEALREKLLDLTLRNRMLNYKPSKRLSVVIEGEDSQTLYSLLVDEGKRFSFIGKPDPVRSDPGDSTSEPKDYSDDVSMSRFREEAIAELDGYLGHAAVPVDKADTKLSTTEYESVLQAKLRTIRREANLVNEELGVNTLFLTLGVLEWQESEAKVCKAPLVFVPVRLDQLANGQVRLVHEGGDAGVNLPLAAKLGEFNLRMPEWTDDKPLITYVNEVAGTIRERMGWRVLPDEVHLGFFSYEKYSMYVDLGGEAWPEGKKPWQNADLAAMLGGQGYPRSESRVTESSQLDSVRPVTECHEVYDADSSQTIAMVRAAEGISMVVEGPPGTGKSQTITNIIAEAVAAGRTVLFVSAKRAALEVVTRRLDEAGLHDVFLDLHDKGANRKEFYDELNRTVKRNLKLAEEQLKVQRLAELRELLNAYSEAVNTPIGRYGVPPFIAMARLARLPKEDADDRAGRITFEVLSGNSVEEIDLALPRVAALQERIAKIGIPIEHPFWGAEIDYLDPSLKLDLETDLAACLSKLETALADWSEAARRLRVEVEPTSDHVRVLQACVARAETAPELDGVAVKASTWRADQAKVESTIEALRSRAAARARQANTVRPDAWGTDVGGLLVTYQDWGHRWYRFLSGAFRSARRHTRALLVETAPADPASQQSALEDIRTSRASEASIQDANGLMQRLFGAQWQGTDSDAEVLTKLLEWVLSLRDEVEQGNIPDGLLDFFAGRTPLPEASTAVSRAIESAQGALAAYREVAAILACPTNGAESTPFTLLLDRVRTWQSELPILSEYIAFREARRQAQAVVPAEVIDVADSWPGSATRLRDTFLRSYFSGVVRQAMLERPELRSFERLGHERAIAEFKSLDDFNLRYNRARVRLEHHRRLPSFESAAGNLQLLKVQCELKRKHKAIRWAMAKAGEAVMRIKPVFMMSPLSVAIHLPPELPAFDLVIFDEASQIRPEDALCAIARAKQCIVVGDTRQMPPTSFFDRVLVDDADEDVDEIREFGAEARKLESVLSLLSAVVGDSNRRPMLRWHYRSIHPSLIQPSNELFYDNRLVIFPSPSVDVAGRRIGVVFHHDPTTVYEAGSGRRWNPKEAGAVAQAVLKHVTNHPEESLLVAAMNKQQADLIYDEVSKIERIHPSVFATFRSQHPHEPLDVKNLETVQGDERDVVMVSITYGRDASGMIRQNFGPILQEGGERRLNVLFTRARRRCEIFSNMVGDDLRNEGGRVGVTTLKAFLNFAERGILYVPESSGEGPESPFEEEVAAALRAAGYQVDSQVGCEGYRIDLCVVDPQQPGRYILGIECDGATYHSARSARDRDKLRQRILEHRGWILHRIWSPDWWQDRDAEVDRLLHAIDAARTANREFFLEADLREEGSYVLDAPEREVKSTLTRPYVVSTGKLREPNELDFIQFVGDTIRVEGPIHHELLLARMRTALGVGRVGSNIRVWFESMLAKVPNVQRIEDAWYVEAAQLKLPRDWSERPGDEKKTTYVTEAEIAAAIKSVVRRSFGIPWREAAREAWTLLGFRRVTDTAIDRADEVLSKLIASGGVVRRDDLLHPPTS